MRSLAQILIDYHVHVYDIISNLVIELYQLGHKQVHVGAKKVCTSTNFHIKIKSKLTDDVRTASD